MNDGRDRGGRPLRILQVIPSTSEVHGGPSRAILSIERALVTSGVAVTTLTTDDDGPGQRLRLAQRPDCVNGAKRVYRRKWTEFYKFAPSIVPWLWHNVERFDVVHIHALFSFTSVAAASISRLKKVPYVVRPLGTLSTYGVTRRRPWFKRLSLRLIEGPILRSAAFVQCTSRMELDEALSHGITFHGGVIPIGIERPLRINHVRSGRPTVLFLSRLDPKKNIEGLLKAIAITVDKHSDILLRIAGDGPPGYVASLKQQIETMMIGSRVEWLGHCEGEAKAEAFGTADVFALPSYSENFGIAAVEAMLEGLPCILGHGVGIAGDIDLARAGWVVATDPEAIAGALAQAFADDEERNRMGERARRFAEREFSTDAMARRLVALYSSLAIAHGGLAK